MGKVKLTLLCLLAVGCVHAQKVIKKSILDPSTTQIRIDAQNCYRIDLSTTSSKEIIVAAVIEGEYKNDLVLKIEDHSPVVEISVDFAPNFIKPNDKLSAHKVISISLDIQIPEAMRVNLSGTNCNVHALGSYDFLRIALDDGSCNLDRVSKASQVITQSGDIHIKSVAAKVVTKTSFGTIFDDTIPEGNDYFDLSTTAGNIYLIKTE